jgi:hypothetical protein
MWHRIRILRWLAPLLVASSCWLPAAQAQAPPSANANAEEGGHNPAFAYTIAFLSTLLIMVIVCTPSRKS